VVGEAGAVLHVEVVRGGDVERAGVAEGARVESAGAAERRRRRGGGGERAAAGERAAVPVEGGGDGDGLRAVALAAREGERGHGDWNVERDHVSAVDRGGVARAGNARAAPGR